MPSPGDMAFFDSASGQPQEGGLDCLPSGDFGTVDPSLVPGTWGSCFFPNQAMPIGLDLSNTNTTSQMMVTFSCIDMRTAA